MSEIGGIFMVILLAFILYPEISKNVLKRWAFPFSSVERITFTQILNDENKIFHYFGK